MKPAARKDQELQWLQLFKSSLKTHLFSCKQDTDTDIVTVDISRPCNGFAMLWHIIYWRIYYYYF